MKTSSPRFVPAKCIEFGASLALPLSKNYPSIRERTASARLSSKPMPPVQPPAPKRKLKSLAPEELSVSMHHTTHPFVFNNGVIFRRPAPVLYRVFSSASAGSRQPTPSIVRLRIQALASSNVVHSSGPATHSRPVFVSRTIQFAYATYTPSRPISLDVDGGPG